MICNLTGIVHWGKIARRFVFFRHMKHEKTSGHIQIIVCDMLEFIGSGFEKFSLIRDPDANINTLCWDNYDQSVQKWLDYQSSFVKKLSRIISPQPKCSLWCNKLSSFNYCKFLAISRLQCGNNLFVIWNLSSKGPKLAQNSISFLGKLWKNYRTAMETQCFQ